MAERDEWDVTSEELDELQWGCDSSDDEMDHRAPRAPTPLEAEQSLSSLLIGLCLAGSMTPKMVCIICYWVSLCGVGGMVARLALKPGSHTSHFSRKFKRVTGFRNSETKVFVDAPGFCRASMSRTVHKVPCIPPHEVLSRETLMDPNLATTLEDAVEYDRLPPSYTSHHVAQSSNFKAQPVIMYLDGVPTTKKDGVLGIWCYMLYSQLRHLVCILPKSKMCRCGCRAWCTLWPIFNFFAWSFAAHAAGLMPLVRWDGMNWDDDPRRAALGGSPLGSLGAVFCIKGDWAEFCLTLGFMAWSSFMHPCLFCLATKAGWADDFDPNAAAFPWDLVDAVRYAAQCAANELPRRLSQVDRVLIARSLYYDKRKHGFCGRVLRKDLPDYNLHAGDRVEPCSSVPDVAAFEHLPGDLDCLFWRVTGNRRVKHRNPLFCAAAGITTLSLVVDVLHTIYLGLAKDLTMHAIWELLLSNAYVIDTNSSSTVKSQMGLQVFKTEYDSWVGRQPDGIVATPVQDLSIAMLGSRLNRCLNIKASETKGMFLFTCTELARKQHMIQGGDLWAACAEHLQSIMTILETAPLKLPTEARQDISYVYIYIYIYINIYTRWWTHDNVSVFGEKLDEKSPL